MKTNNNRYFTWRPITTGTLHEDQYTFLIISRWILLRMRTVSDKTCRENQNTHFVFNNPPPENRAVYKILWENMEDSDRPYVEL